MLLGPYFEHIRALILLVLDRTTVHLLKNVNYYCLPLASTTMDQFNAKSDPNQVVLVAFVVWLALRFV